MNMQNVSDGEIMNSLRNVSDNKKSNEVGISDESLIAMTQKTFNGENPVESGSVLSEVRSNMHTSDSSNYWPIKGMPSKGKFYPKNSIIEGRPLKVIEVKKISSINDGNGDFIINDILKRTIKTSFPFDEIYIADKLFMVFWLRENTYRESGFVVKFECLKCKKVSDFHFELNNLEVQIVNDNFSPESEITLPSGSKVKYDYLKIKDEIFIDRFKEINGSEIPDLDDDLLGIAQMIKSINGDNSSSLIKKYFWVLEMSPADYSALTTMIEKNGMGIRPYVNVECQKCGGTVPVAVSFRADFFIPEYKF